MDLRQYRLNEWDWIKEYKAKYGDKYYHAYKDKICYMLSLLKPGKSYNFSGAEKQGSRIFIVEYETDGIKKEESNPDLFIKICCMFIHSNEGYVFNDEYDKITRNE